LFASVTSSPLNTGVILAILSFDGQVPNLIDVSSISVRTGIMTALEHLSNLVGEEYKP